MRAQYPSSSQVVTADIVLGESGKPLVIYYIHALSTAGGASVINIRDGSTVGGTVITQINIAGASTAAYKDYGDRGINFPNGAFIDVDANTSYVTICYMQTAPC